MPEKYRVTTEDGVYEITVGDEKPGIGLTPPPGYTPSTPEIPDESMRAGVKFGMEMLPVAGMTAMGLAAPPSWPVAIGMSALGGAAGSAAKQGLQMAFDMPEAPKSAGEYARGLGEDALEGATSEFGGKIVSGILGKLFGRMVNPEQLYQSALKPPPGGGREMMRRQVGAGLEERIPVSEEGLAKAEQTWQKLNQQIDAAVATDPNAPIQPHLVVSRLNELRQKWKNTPEFLKVIDEEEKNFLKQFPALTAEQSQELKKEMYARIRMEAKAAWKEGNTPGISVQAQQKLAKGLKEELEFLFPTIKDLNRKEGAVIELERALNRFVAREGNQRITSFFLPPAIGALTGGFVGGGSGAAAGAALGTLGAGLMRAVFEDPTVKSKLAILLKRASEHAVGKVGKAAAKQAPAITIRTGQALYDAYAPMEPPPGR